MTRIIIWPNREFSEVSIAADTKLSGGLSKLTENASKILGLPIRLRARYEEENGGPPRTEAIFETNIAFAFAGSALAATSTYSYVASVFTRLVGWEWEESPSGQDIADFVARVGTRYVRDISISNPNNAPFEAALVMVDPKQRHGERRKIQIFHLTKDDSVPYKMIAKPYEHRLGVNCLVLGHEVDLAYKQLDDAYKENSAYKPTDYLQREIDNQEQKTIGGRIHYADVTDSGLRIRPLRLLCEHGETISADSSTRVGSYTFSSGISGDW